MSGQGESSNGGKKNDERSREEVLAEREAAKEAKKAAKLAKQAKAASGNKKAGGNENSIEQSSSGSKKQSGGEAVAKSASASGSGRGGPAAGSGNAANTPRPRSQAGPSQLQPGSRPSTASGQDRITGQSIGEKGAGGSNATPAKPSILGGIALFGNVAVAKTAPEMRQHIVSASYRAQIHPSVLKTSQHLASFSIVGADARAIAVLKALRDFIVDYRTPPGAVLNRDLVTKLGPQIGFLVNARPLGASAGHAIRYLKYEISVTPVDLDEIQSKNHIISRIDHFVRDRITYATRVIATTLASGKLKDGAVVLTFGKSSVVQQTLLEAWQRGTRFSVIIVDARPLCEGRKLLASLTEVGIPCTYGLLTSLSTLVSRASIVLLGTASLLANGALYARAGTAPCAMMAKAKGVPVIVCCETYKFSERVQLDGFVVNEAGDPSAILRPLSSSTISNADNLALEDDQQGPLAEMITKEEWEKSEALGAVNLLYDLTPPRYVTAVASEVGLSGPESVGVILRDYKSVLYGQ